MRATCSLIVLLFSSTLLAQEGEWARQWESAQRERPGVLSSVGRIAPASEPGTPLIIHGRVYQRDGSTPAAGIVVFAYHTDATGVYHAAGGSGWRLRGWAKSDSEGRFELRTIRPAPYPRGGAAAHIHVTVEAPEPKARWADGILFLDDPIVSEADRRDSAAKGRFGTVRPVALLAGVQHVDYNIAIARGNAF